jgi:predicted nucleic acid-binding protein
VKQQAVFDSSFWINAHRSGLLRWVLQRFMLHYPPDVATEMHAAFPSGQAFWEHVRTGILTESAPQQAAFQEFSTGERAAINVALEHPDWTLLIDDYRPFRAAEGLGLPVLCTPVLTVQLLQDGDATAADTLTMLARLAAMQTVSPHLLARALVQADQWLGRQGGQI